MTFLMEPDTGVLRLSNKRRQGMKLSYLLNVSVSDGVFTNTAQVRQPRRVCTPALLVDLDFRLSSLRHSYSRTRVPRFFFFLFFNGHSLQISSAHPQLSSVIFFLFFLILLAAALLCSLELMCIYVTLDLL